MNIKLKNKNVISLILTIVMLFGVLPKITADAVADGKPGSCVIQANQWGEDTDGNYDLSVFMYYGNNGTSYKLYERFTGTGDFKVVEEGALTDNSPNQQSFVIPIKGRQGTGTYYYYVELINKYGSTNGAIASVNVGFVETSNISISGVDAVKVETQFTVKQGKSSYTLTDAKTTSPKFTVITSNSTVAKATITNNNILNIEGISAGRAGIKIKDETTGEVRYIGCRVLTSDNQIPGLPNYLSLGQVSEDIQGDLDFWKDFDSDDTNKRMDIRYIYVNGGPLNGWKSSTPDPGMRVKKYINESRKLGLIPYFVYYNIPDSAEDYGIDLKHINDKTYMDAYYKDLKFFLDILNEYVGDDKVGIILEPDFIGYMMQQSKLQPDQIVAAGVETSYSSGVLKKGTDPDFPNTVKGLVESINYIINKNYPSAHFGWQFNTWGYTGEGTPSNGLMHATEVSGWDKGREFIRKGAVATANYYMNAGILSYGADFISIDKYGLDGVGYEPGKANDPKSSTWFWNADLWNNYLYYTKTLHETTKMPVTLWQLPVGHINSSQEQNPYNGGTFPDLNNTTTKYEDSAPSFFFGDTFKPGVGNRLNYFGTNDAKDPKVTVSGDKVTWESHMQEAKDAGVTTMLFGAGVGTSTDCVGNPPADGYWWITKAQRYYKNPIPIDNINPIIIPEDINNDGKVDLSDLSMVAVAYNTKIGDSKWNVIYDVNKDNIVDIYDLVKIARKIS